MKEGFDVVFTDARTWHPPTGKVFFWEFDSDDGETHGFAPW